MTLIQNILKLIDRTKARKIEWEQVNPSSFIWTSKASNGEQINIVVQRIPRQGKQDVIFRLFNVTTQKTLLDISHQDSSPEIKSLLEELFVAITGNVPFVDDIFTDILNKV
jgi:hypothetical protein